MYNKYTSKPSSFPASEKSIDGTTRSLIKTLLKTSPSGLEFDLVFILSCFKSLSILQAVEILSDLRQVGIIDIVSEKLNFQFGKFAKITYRVN